MEATRYTLQSTAWCNTPGLARWAQNGAKFKKDKRAMLKVFTEGYGLPESAANKVLDGDCIINDDAGTVMVEI